jgi:hypothetical protein
MNEKEIEGPRAWDRMSGLERRRILDWIVEGCLIHGATEYTSYLVAAEFAKGLAR